MSTRAHNESYMVALERLKTAYEEGGIFP